jgi:hypothetical protein
MHVMTRCYARLSEAAAAPPRPAAAPSKTGSASPPCSLQDGPAGLHEGRHTCCLPAAFAHASSPWSQGLLGHTFFGERLTRQWLLGVAIVICGLVLISKAAALPGVPDQQPSKGAAATAERAAKRD